VYFDAVGWAIGKASGITFGYPTWPGITRKWQVKENSNVVLTVSLLIAISVNRSVFSFYAGQ